MRPEPRVVIYANSVEQARHRLQELNLDPAKYRIETSPESLRGFRGLDIRRIGRPGTSESERCLTEIVASQQHTLTFGL